MVQDDSATTAQERKHVLTNTLTNTLTTTLLSAAANSAWRNAHRHVPGAPLSGEQ
jgi:hypothetical protein